jgi:dTDP-glucose 4,6-dehydratase/UDP-glucuronate decarboxylase
VDCVDNLITGRAENVQDLTRMKDFRFIKGDVVDPALIEMLMKRRYRDVYHLACPTGVPNIDILGEEMMLACSVGTLNLLKVAVASKARFLYVSTAEVYGDPEEFPQREDYVGNVDPVGPRSTYEEGKRFGEALTAHYAKKSGLETRIVRIFNTYGPGMSPKDKRVIPQLMNSILRRRPFVIYGDGSQTRSFLHVDDLISGLSVIMERGAKGGVYNVGGDKELTILELVERARALTDTGLELIFKEHFIQDHGRRCPDLTKVKSLGWRQHIPIEVGLATTYAGLVRSRLRVRRPALMETVLPRPGLKTGVSLPASAEQVSVTAAS